MRTLTLALVLALGACSSPPPAPAPVPGAFPAQGATVFTVNGTAVTDKMIEAATAGMPKAQLEQLKASGQFAQLEEQLALGELIYQQAVDKKLHEQEDVKAALAMANRQILAGEFLRKHVADAVTDEAMKKHYEERAVQYKRPEAKVRHILVKEESLAAEIVEKLKSGADFAKLANEHSLDPGSKARGGDLGWTQQGRTVPEFDKASFEGPVGQVQPPVQTNFGYHIIEVQERRDATPFEDVKDQIEQELSQEVQQKFLEELRLSMKIERVGDKAAGDTPADAPAAPAGHGKDDGHNH